MAAAGLLKSLRDCGLTVVAEGDLVHVRPRELLTHELRAAIRAHKPELLAELGAANDARLDATADPGTERRRAKAIALLKANASWKRAMVGETGPPPVMGVAIRGVAYGEIELPADYDPALLLVLIKQHGNIVH